jgi:hypothetical protein
MNAGQRLALILREYVTNPSHHGWQQVLKALRAAEAEQSAGKSMVFINPPWSVCQGKPTNRDNNGSKS